MIYLKIDNKVGKFYKEGTYVTIDKMVGCPVRCSGKQKLKSPVKLLIQHSEI